ncbi:hypothetical protein HT094_11240 [Shewanella sp. ZOR0012]|nr:hypothetical protein [Shewanella sp. ZOR0012]
MAPALQVTAIKVAKTVGKFIPLKGAWKKATLSNLPMPENKNTMLMASVTKAAARF